jgi:hypothetical protein
MTYDYRRMLDKNHLALALLVSAAFTCSAAVAQQGPAAGSSTAAPATSAATPAPKTGGPTASPPGAAVYFVDLKEGQTVPPNFVVHFGLTNIGVAPAGTDHPNSGHHHLLIDTELPPLNEPIPSDFNHLHFGAGQTEAQLSLQPGPHTLQLLLGDKDHIPHTPPVMSAPVHIVVSGTPATASKFERTPSPKGARVYFVGLGDGSYVTQNPIIRFGLLNMGIAPAGVAKPNTGHHHLLIDTALPPLDQPIPSDFNHLHFGAGQTEAQITLPLGMHKLQLLLGDENHVPHDPPVMSQQIRVFVTTTGQRPIPPRRVPPKRRYHN